MNFLGSCCRACSVLISDTRVQSATASSSTTRVDAADVSNLLIHAPSRLSLRGPFVRTLSRVRLHGSSVDGAGELLKTLQLLRAAAAEQRRRRRRRTARVSEDRRMTTAAAAAAAVVTRKTAASTDRRAGRQRGLR